MPGRAVLASTLATVQAQRLPAVLALGYVVLYLLLDWVSFVHPMRGTTITAWNPQAALAVALLTWRPQAWWLVAATLVAAALLHADPATAAADLAASATQIAGYLFAAMALQRWLGPLPRISTRRTYLVFLLVVATSAALNAGLYAATLGALGSPSSDRLFTAFLRGWIGDVVSLVVMLPIVYAVADTTRRAESVAMARSVEGWLVATAAMLIAYVVFGRSAEEQFKLFYLLFLPVAWGAARFGHVGAAWSAGLVQLLLMLAVQSSPYQPLTVFELHMLMSALGATGLLLGATVDEREQADHALRASLHVAAAGDMAAALAHELNQPLSAIRSYARASQLLARRPEAPAGDDVPSLRDVTTRLVAEADRAADIVKRLRDFFRRRSTELRRESVAALIEAAMQLQVARAESLQVRLEWHTDDLLPSVWIDRVQIDVVLRNLVSNAIEAAAEGDARHPCVSLQVRVAGDEVVIAVHDTGPGIAPQDLRHCFDSRRSSKPGGMGIGLAISRSIVEAHEGRLWAEPGPGGHFFVSLPLAADEPE